MHASHKRWAAGLVAAVALGGLSAPSADAARSKCGSGKLDTVETALLKRIADYRQQHGRRALKRSACMTKVADSHVKDMFRHQFFGHRSSNGRSERSRLSRAAGTSNVRENLGLIGQPEGVGEVGLLFNAWLGSAGHRRNLLARDLRRVGVARRTGQFKGQLTALYTVTFAGSPKKKK